MNDQLSVMHESESNRPILKGRRRLLRFSLRTLLLLMAIASLLFAWLGKHIVRTHTQRPIVARIQAAGGSAYYDFQLQPGRIDFSKSPPGSGLVRSVLGDDIYASVSVVFLNDPATKDADLVGIHKLEDLLDLSLLGNGITDNCIEELLKINRLRSLNLMDTTVTPQGLARLSGSKTLQHLTLSGSNISDSHLEKLDSFPNLQFLQVIRAPVTDKGIKSLESIVRLRQIDIFFVSAVTDSGFKQLEHLTNLEQLRIHLTGLTDDSMPTISRMTALKSLQLNGHAITDEGFRYLQSLKALEELQLADTQITDISLETIVNMPHLRLLKISGTGITDNGLLHLKPLSNLEHLDISRTSVTDRGLASLYDLKSLLFLDIEIDNHISLSGVDKLKTQLPNCEINCWKIEPNGTGVLVETR